jgi:hypothetical protein
LALAADTNLAPGLCQALVALHFLRLLAGIGARYRAKCTSGCCEIILLGGITKPMD